MSNILIELGAQNSEISKISDSNCISNKNIVSTVDGNTSSHAVNRLSLFLNWAMALLLLDIKTKKRFIFKAIEMAHCFIF